MTTRYKRTILATCCIPWRADGQLDEDLFRQSVRRLLDRGFHDLYIFGTAGEGHSVADGDYRLVVDVFAGEIKKAGEQPMIGVINLSLATVIERIEYAADRGCTTFQVSLPNWGAVNDRELRTFFRETCGRFPQLSFVHYNLLRTGRIVQPQEYARLSADHHNLVATKYGGGDPELIAGLVTLAPSLRHFFTELGFFYGSVIGECGLLASISSTHPRRAREYFDAAGSGDIEAASPLFRELATMMVELRTAVGDGPHLDGAYDKILAKIADARFPLRLLPPWQESTEEAYNLYRATLENRFPAWLEFAPADSCSKSLTRPSVTPS